MTFPFEPATHFGAYRLSARIATGGMAEVYAARRIDADGTAGPMVALKRLLPHLKSDPIIVRMFLNEARITAQIHHPNVVEILDLGNETGEPYIAMELLEGHSFADVRQRAAMKGDRVPLGITLKVLAEACRGLDAAHRAVDEEGRLLCIVHRDFTPDNIHVGVDGRVKVIDFGIAKASNLGSGTEPGTLKGKFFYMSPEMISGHSVDHRADVFAAGVMLYEQLCGRRPFTGHTPDEVVERIALTQPRRPTEFDPSVPPALEAVCLAALKKDPVERFQTLQHFVAAIEAIGGAAVLASDQALGAYLRRLFPLEEDSRRLQLQHARELDPSHPGHHPAALPEPASSSSSASSSEAAAAVPFSPSPPHASRSSGGTRAFLKISAALVIVGAAAAGGAFVLARPGEPPSELLARAEALQDRAPRAAALGALGSDDRATADQLTRAGELLLEVGAWEAALRLAESFARRYPKTLEARLLEAEACIGLRHGRRAEQAITAARELEPNSPEPDLLLAKLRELKGDLSGATESLAVALRKEPQSVKVARRHGYLLSQRGRLDEAASVLTAALKREFEAEAAAELAFVRFRQGRSGEATTLLRRALKARPQLARAHYYLGAVLFREGDAAGAERAYLAAENWAPEDSRALVALCELLNRRGRRDDAAAVRARIRERFPEEAATLVARCGDSE